MAEAEARRLRVSSNQRRTSWRVRCRRRLASHIKEDTLGLQIEPDDVRLQPDDETRYAWQVDDPELESLFEKALSKHSVGAYIELCSEVGRSFRAVHRDQVVKGGRSVTDRLRTLQVEHDTMEQAVRAVKEQNQSLHAEKIALERRLRDAEEDAAKRISEMEHKITTLEENISRHQRDTKEWMSVAECYERTYTQCSTGLNQAILFLQGLSAENCLPDGGSALANP
ncbi:hypothetical protein IFM53868_08432 [Aspergillus udagawae]|uniref:Uncharacterized protein n=1 Tax=Aspergillus udagawae TaxID=91492 RepID=A0ABQ1B8S7_9EURO|nr:hypothetical protein IFM53868_08432 [Aspergillus udagawae]